MVITRKHTVQAKGLILREIISNILLIHLNINTCGVSFCPNINVLGNHMVFVDTGQRGPECNTLEWNTGKHGAKYSSSHVRCIRKINTCSTFITNTH